MAVAESVAGAASAGTGAKRLSKVVRVSTGLGASTTGAGPLRGNRPAFLGGGFSGDAVFFLDTLGGVLGIVDDVLGLVLGHAGQLSQFGRLQERQIIVGQEAFLDERFDHVPS